MSRILKGQRRKKAQKLSKRAQLWRFIVLAHLDEVKRYPCRDHDDDIDLAAYLHFI